jgi:hypothetical protein
MGSPNIANVGAYFKAVVSAGSRLVAAGSGDDTEVEGVAVDRLGFSSGKLVLSAHANNTVDKKLTNKYLKVQYSEDGTNWATAETLVADAVDVVTGTGDKYGAQVVDIDFRGKARYVKAIYKPDHTASGTDVAELTATFLLGGADVLPAA